VGIIDGIRRHREAKAEAARIEKLQAQPANLYDLELATKEAEKVPGLAWEVDRLRERVDEMETQTKTVMERVRDLEMREQ
jgi:hypothetical protein